MAVGFDGWGTLEPLRVVAVELSSLGYAVSRGFKRRAIRRPAAEPRSRTVAIVDELARRGLIERRPDATDRRIREL